MAKVVTSKSRRQAKQLGDVTLLKGNAAEMGGFNHMRMGHEIARPTVVVDGQQVFMTPTGRQFTVKKMSS